MVIIIIIFLNFTLSLRCTPCNKEPSNNSVFLGVPFWTFSGGPQLSLRIEYRSGPTSTLGVQMLTFLELIKFWTHIVLHIIRASEVYFQAYRKRI